jgi:hypothetical protein
LLVASFLGTIFNFKLNQNRTELVPSNQWNDKIASDDEALEDVIFGTGFGTVTDLEVALDGYLMFLAAALENLKEKYIKFYRR